MEGDGLDGNAADASPKCMVFITHNMTASSVQGIFFLFFLMRACSSPSCFVEDGFYLIYRQVRVQWTN